MEPVAQEEKGQETAQVDPSRGSAPNFARRPRPPLPVFSSFSYSPGPFPSAASSFLARGRGRGKSVRSTTSVQSGGEVTQAYALNPPRGNARAASFCLALAYLVFISIRVFSLSTSPDGRVKETTRFQLSWFLEWCLSGSWTGSRFYSLLRLWFRWAVAELYIIWTFFRICFFFVFHQELYSNRFIIRYVSIF